MRTLLQHGTLFVVCQAACAGEAAPPFFGVSVHVTSCDLSPCSIWTMARGGAASLALTADPSSLEGTALVSMAPDVVEVLDYDAHHDVANVEIAARSSGPAKLTLLDARGALLDQVSIEVRAADRLLFSPESDGPMDLEMIPGFGQHFTVDVGTTVTVHVRPIGGDDFLSGTFATSVTVDESAVPQADWLAPIDPPTVERFVVTSTRGDHDISVDALGLGVSARLRLTGR